MNVRQWIALILIAPIAILFWILTLIEIIFYPYVAVVVGLLANGQWLSFKRYLDEVVGRPFGG